MSTPPTRPDVDALREKLRALGYLDAGMDRFVLGSARSGIGVRRLALHASARIGLFSGLLAGVPGALATAVRLPGLVTGVRDALVLAAYVSVSFGAAAALAAFGAILLAGRLTRSGRASGPAFAHRARRWSVAAGAAVGLLCLVYLTLWWRATGPLDAPAGVVATWLALGLAALVSLTLAYVTAETARAVLAIEATADVPVAPVRLSWRTTAGIACGAILASAALLAVTTRRAQEPLPPRPVVVTTGIRLTVVAIDGFDPAFARRVLIPRLPAGEPTGGGRADPSRIARLLDAAPRARIAPDETGDPVRAWTTVATGQPPDRHGVSALEVRRLAGLAGRVPDQPSPLSHVLSAATDMLRLTRPVVATGIERRARAFWEVAARAGLTTATVNWWTTWPAGEDDGLVLTDRAVLRLERGGPLDGEIAPATLYDEVRARWPALRASAHARAVSAFDTAPAHAAGAWLRSAEIDAQQFEMATIPELRGADLLAIYLPGLDIAQAAWPGPAAARLAPSAVADHLDGLERYYRFLASQIDAIADARGEGVLVLVTLPGRFVAGVDGSLSIDLGPTTRTSSDPAEVARPEDVAPTLLYALGLPVSRELTGRPLLDLFPREFVDRWPPREIATYGRRDRPPSRGTARSLDDEMRERLRSLGYVQ
jgi:hypothetical protein